MKSILKPLTLLLFLLVHPVSAFSADDQGDGTAVPDSISKQNINKPMQYRIGYTIGWKVPYGLGVDFSILDHGLIDVNIGCGYSITGVRVSLGSRIFFFPWSDVKFTPMLGLFMSFASGEGVFSPANLGGVAEGDYKIKPFFAAGIETGFCYRFDQKVTLECGVGYTKQLGRSPVKLYFGNLYVDTRTYLEKSILNGRSIYIGALIALPNKHHHLK